MTKKTKILTTKNIAFAAVLAALCVVTNSFAIATGPFKLTFSYTVCFVAGHFFGPIVGGLVGVFGDAMGCLAKGYAPDPLLAVGSILIGVLPGLVQYLSRLFKIKQRDVYGVVWTVVSLLLVYVVVTVFWNTFALWIMYGKGTKTYWAYMAGRIAPQTAVWAINLGLSLVLYPVLSRVLHFAPTTIWDYIKRLKEEKQTKEQAPKQGEDVELEAEAVAEPTAEEIEQFAPIENPPEDNTTDELDH